MFGRYKKNSASKKCIAGIEIIVGYSSKTPNLITQISSGVTLCLQSGFQDTANKGKCLSYISHYWSNVTAAVYSGMKVGSFFPIVAYSNKQTLNPFRTDVDYSLH